MSFERHSWATSRIASLDSIQNAGHAHIICPASRDSSEQNSRPTRHQPFAVIERHSPLKSAPTSPVFSVCSALLPEGSHLIENKTQTHICKSLDFNQFRTLFHFSPASPLFSVCSPKHTGGIPPSHLGHESSITTNSAKSPAIIAFSLSNARYDTMTPANKVPGAVRATA
jgi:hypothetical protein